ncbi:MAG: phosphatase PAP2 family protein [Vulcanimicrobiota bacterium]
MRALVFVLLGLGVLRELDALAYAWLAHPPNQLSIWASHFGDNLAYLVAGLYALWLLRRGQRGELSFFLLLLAGQHLWVNLSKALFHSLRPLQAAQVGGFAYPSGHTAMATCVYGTLARRQHRAWAVLILVVAWARMALGHHWLSDVLGGGLLGWMWLDACPWQVGANLGVSNLPAQGAGVDQESAA